MKVRGISKSLCCNCNLDEDYESADIMDGVCSVCYSVFCENCSVDCLCIECKKLACDDHSTKCSICWSRVCTGAKCSDKVYYCEHCNNNFCHDDYEVHKAINNSSPYKLNCQLVKCKIKLIQRTLVSVEEVCTHLTHLSRLKELQFRSAITRK